LLIARESQRVAFCSNASANHVMLYGRLLR
jgi:hypothetical protein